MMEKKRINKKKHNKLTQIALRYSKDVHPRGRLSFEE
jgi:hypothetical protein